jgi:hypothetical protein
MKDATVDAQFDALGERLEAAQIPENARRGRTICWLCAQFTVEASGHGDELLPTESRQRR